jgi:hypothetical protein
LIHLSNNTTVLFTGIVLNYPNSNLNFMPVKEPQQNTHRWWGTLTRDATTEVTGGDLPPNQECIFIKTSADAHFLPQGTVIKRLKILGTSGNINTVLANTSLPSQGSSQISADLVKYPGGPDTIVTEILEIDQEASSPLAQEVFDLTETLFHDDEWLARNGARVGKADIELGRELPRLPPK